MSFDHMIRDVEISNFFKKILHARQILFFIVNFTNFFLIYWNIKIDKIEDNKDNATIILKQLFYYSFLTISAVLAFLILYLKFRPMDGMYIKRSEELEKFILSKSEELSNNQCGICKVTRCMRSVHCEICNSCIAKFELHSDWFHICIGSMNLLIYILVLLTLNLYFILSFLYFSFQILFLSRDDLLYDLKKNEFVFHFWIIIWTYLMIKLFFYTYDFLKSGIFKNLTDYEGFNWRRLTYLWRSMRKDYFNPFDKGISGNLRELWVNFWNPPINLTDKINLRLNSNENLSMNETANTNNSINSTLNIEEKDDDILILDSETEKRSPKKVSKNFSKNESYFITSDNEYIYREYSGNVEDFVNWNRTRFYTVLDLKNSPLRVIVLKMQRS
jgi:palmitoyltransferase